MRRWMGVALLLVLLLPAAGLAGLYGIRAAETYDPFCTSCHLQDHQDYLDDGRREKRAIRSLGGWHLSSGKARCISCHGEDGVAGMIRTTLLAAGDTWRFVIGDYEVPARVFHPIQDKDCLKCHPDERILKLPAEAFHGISDHAELKASCVQCHSGHKTGGRREKVFIVPAFAQPRCDACHKDLKQKVRAGEMRFVPAPASSGGAFLPARPDKRP
ncbi:MAG: NapC/NirT family cytochrome c [Candidatus Tectomicrobia bacterium]|uniref:NapC/NirT family cytochrome c n=1 Tax=Tectimicrobiota bacterium TaxID=2528274 RepID=A0A932MQQ2_UNCTE|nr:NapC/NirT family cytochrome c [Candidatus Tectomicrobia bacterium]